MERFAMFVNPQARHGDALSRLKSILARTPSLARRARVHPLTTLKETVEQLKKLDPGDLPVAAGGDGTVQMMARALRMAGLEQKPLALLPLGTGNAFAHGMGLGDLATALGALDSPRHHPVDVFVTTHPDAPVVLSSLSIGLESRTVRGLAEGQGWGRYVQGFSRGMAGIASHWSGTTVTLDGESFLASADKAYNVGLYNQPFYAFGKKVHPKADPWDGKGLAVLHDRADAYWRAVILGSPGDGAVGTRARSWQRAEIDTPHTVQADGESLPAGRFSVTVDRHGLTLVVPEGFPGGPQ